jgi:hypothetical protein
VKELCRTKGFDYAIISAKYGLLLPNEQIEGYEKMLKNRKDVEEVRPKVEERLKEMLNRYDKVIVIAGSNYLRVLEGLADERFSHVKARGYGDLCSKVRKGTRNLAIRPIEEFLET